MGLVLLSIAGAALPIVMVSFRTNELTHLSHIMDVLDDAMLFHVLYETLLLTNSTHWLSDCCVLDLEAATQVAGLLVRQMLAIASIEYAAEPS